MGTIKTILFYKIEMMRGALVNPLTLMPGPWGYCPLYEHRKNPRKISKMSFM
jgi:hypothetical protein